MRARGRRQAKIIATPHAVVIHGGLLLWYNFGIPQLGIVFSNPDIQPKKLGLGPCYRKIGHAIGKQGRCQIGGRNFVLIFTQRLLIVWHGKRDLQQGQNRTSWGVACVCVVTQYNLDATLSFRVGIRFDQGQKAEVSQTGVLFLFLEFPLRCLPCSIIATRFQPSLSLVDDIEFGLLTNEHSQETQDRKKQPKRNSLSTPGMLNAISNNLTCQIMILVFLESAFSKGVPPPPP